MNRKYQPAEIEVRNSDHELFIRWGDEHNSVYPLFGLRKNCPCVTCRGGHGKMNAFERSLFLAEPNRVYTIEDIKQIGNHAIRIYWNDNHSSGMYQWERLRKLCPCPECYPKEDKPVED